MSEEQNLPPMMFEDYENVSPDAGENYNIPINPDSLD